MLLNGLSSENNNQILRTVHAAMLVISHESLQAAYNSWRILGENQPAFPGVFLFLVSKGRGEMKDSGNDIVVFRIASVIAEVEFIQRFVE